ncbi:putative disease resistance RPP13-like protein 3 [Salvia hispanica]|uniref:putative disease resistance RPP13-like protein 3 n=1 Tax=Salvia hispanica TaxID=49212 RepID=UPI0020096A05|nr:putative disease resistance RPP13-like protein 3 [Salvia hispanica]
MSEAIISGALQKLESVLVEPLDMDTNTEELLKEVIDELREMLDFWRRKDSRKRSMLNYLLADFAEIAQYSADLTIHIHEDKFYNVIFPFLCILTRTRRHMERFVVGKGVSSVGEDEGVVVGLEKDVQQLIGKVILNEELQHYMTLCIKGMIGVGKTTLARRVYNHTAIVEKFKHRRAWISMSPNISIHEVLVELVKQMLVELDGDSLLLEEMDNRSLRQMLCQHMEGMPYFIVLDNMPRELLLLSFYIDLPTGHGCRMLITCQQELPAEDIFYTHEMKALDSEKSWKLFSKTIDKFTSCENKFSKELEWKAKEMLKKCGGLPMAIINVGRQKAEQRLSGIEWEELFDSIDLSESLKSLEPMYHELDEIRQSCFLHMSFFKENAIMREEKLDHIWTITGTNTRRTSEDGEVINISRFHIDYLVSESIIEVVHDFRYYEVKRCRTNLLLHMLSIKIAQEKLGLEIIRNDGNDRPSQSPRHRIIHCGRDKFNHSTNQEKNLVSLIFHGGGDFLDNATSSYWKSFDILSILDMEDFGVKTLSETIGTLMELRYLGLRNNYIQEIPYSLGGLKRLEVFDIALNFMVEVPDIINEMASLCHLYMSDVIYPKPLKVDAPLNLETLTYISIYDWTYEVSSLEKMTRLQ